MKEKNYTGLVPDNEKGRAISVEAYEIFDTTEQARAFYRIASDRLLFVHNWGKIAGTLSADFQLTDGEGKVVDRPARKGDYFRIDITGPGSKAGEGYDWARVEDIREFHEENIDSIAMRVRPASNPQSNNDDVAHFYSEQSTSTFVVTRETTRVTATIYDRNIEPNDETNGVIDKVRNAIVGLGAKHGLSRLQWETLAKALVDDKK